MDWETHVQEDTSPCDDKKGELVNRAVMGGGREVKQFAILIELLWYIFENIILGKYAKKPPPSHLHTCTCIHTRNKFLSVTMLVKNTNYEEVHFKKVLNFKEHIFRNTKISKELSSCPDLSFGFLLLSEACLSLVCHRETQREISKEIRF